MSPADTRRAIDADLSAQLRAGADFAALYPLLRRYWDLGIDADAVLEHLRTLRGAMDDQAREDRVLELMDIACGFCSPALRLW